MKNLNLKIIATLEIKIDNAIRNKLENVEWMDIDTMLTELKDHIDMLGNCEERAELMDSYTLLCSEFDSLTKKLYGC